MRVETSFMNCINGKNGDNPTELTRIDIENVAKQFVEEASLMEEEELWGCHPINCEVFAFCPPELVNDLIHCEGFIDVGMYPKQSKIIKNEIGSIRSATIISTDSSGLIDKISPFGYKIYSMKFVYFLKDDKRLKKFIKKPCTSKDMDRLDLRATLKKGADESRNEDKA